MMHESRYIILLCGEEECICLNLMTNARLTGVI